MGREAMLLALALLFVLGVAATVRRLVEGWRSGWSLRLQVFVPLAATTLVLSTAFAVIVIDRFTARASLFASRAAEDEARVVAELLARALDAPGASLSQVSLELKRTLSAFAGSAADTGVAVLDERERVLASAGDLDPGIARATGEAPIRSGGRTVGLVRVRKATFGMVQLMSDVAPKVALLSFLFAIASAAVSIFIGGAVAAPIERLTRGAQRVAAGERQAPLPEPRGREVRALTHALESMRSELEERHALEQFVKDLSHELKNPVAAIRASAEVLVEGAADEPETARRFALRIRESADKLQQLTSDLLSLARLEARGIAAGPAPIDLARVAREAAEAWAAGAAARGVSLEVRAEPPALVRGDPNWLRRALENLLGNAVQHSPGGGRVVLEVIAEGGEWVALVRDSGPGVDSAIRERLFERFATTRHGDGGTGLGLAIVRAVAELHGGRALLRESGPGGAVFALALPRVRTGLGGLLQAPPGG